MVLCCLKSERSSMGSRNDRWLAMTTDERTAYTSGAMLIFTRGMSSFRYAKKQR